ncbi:hypothetical protein UFOVP344_41 [uncultured Caudovirales phage]|uniref:Uncharacterized protein n=1 Tax=uncultured Caudovirales phage TaxID=2100421 RepID=A0A6J5M4G6_9CAUD|nr:hypothetical protein UFOVP344_41 [uncultured Caudovirales phage]
MTICPHCVAGAALGASASYPIIKHYRPHWIRLPDLGLALRLSIVATALWAAPVF